jgi:hypothetical protein
LGVADWMMPARCCWDSYLLGRKKEEKEQERKKR